MKLGKFNRCKVRDVWSTENEFSDWLFTEKNIELLSESLALGTIQTESREDKVGGFRADIVGVEMDTGKKVIIENQFEISDHDHLGKIITYAAGKDASIIIWVVEEARPEHSSAIEWLNNNLSDKGFFLVEIELWRIDDSLPAPKFNIVEKPNVWIQATKSDTDPTKQFKYEYWQKFLDHAKNNKDFLRAYPGTETRKPTSDHWYSFMKGCKGDYHIDSKIFTRGGKLLAISSDVWIRDNKEQFLQFESHKADIEDELGFSMEWDNKESNKACSVRIKRDVQDGEPLESTFDWLMDMAVRMRAVFNKYA